MVSAPARPGLMPALSPTTTRAEALAALRRAFAAAGIDQADLDARVLLCALSGIDAARLISEPDHPLGAAARAVGDAVVRRLAREPVSRILGWREFFGRTFEITPATLDPRPDTETVVDAVLGYVQANGGRQRHWRILDFGTGSGCLLVTLLAELPNATGVGVDISGAALEVAARNAARLGVGGRAVLVIADGLEQVEPAFDILVANPPYIPSAQIATLASEVRDYDPHMALDGGADGLDQYRRLVECILPLVPNGYLAFEVGRDQAAAVAALIAERARGRRWPAPELVADLAGIDRCVTQTTRQ